MKRAREEHRAAIEWLNNHTDDNISFFLCEIKLYRIGNADPAIKLEVIEKPNDWTKVIKKNETINKTKHMAYDYWIAFQDYAFRNGQFARNFNQRNPSQDQWIDFAIGSSGCYISLSQKLKDNQLAALLNIRYNKELFYSLLQHKDSIESESGLCFNWRELPNCKSSQIVIEKAVNLTDKNQWNEQFDWLIDVMIRMKMTFKKYL